MIKIDKNWKAFCEVDPFNPGNEVKGYINFSEGNYYGSLLIVDINGWKTEQLVRGTPKFHYPFDKLGEFRFPATKKINIYTKYDGTNILGYQYQYKELVFVSYKVRLRPFVRDSKFGPFFSMWNEMLDKYRPIKNSILNTDYNLSFELYGSRNLILVLYQVLLDTVLLFGINRKTNELIDPENIKSVNVPHANLEDVITKGSDFEKKYKEIQYLKEKKLIFSEENNSYTGDEGVMWYVHTIDGTLLPMKCKPETIQKIHFAIGSSIDENSIRTTILNSLEMNEEITYDLVSVLLKEEFTDEQIKRNEPKIKRIMEEVIEEKKFESKVLDKFDENCSGKELGKNEVMRIMSGFFNKSEMRKVYVVLKNKGKIYS